MMIKMKHFWLAGAVCLMICLRIVMLVSWEYLGENTIALTVMFPVCVLIAADIWKEESNVRIILLAGLLVRLVLAISQSCLDGMLNVFVLSKDQYKFYEISRAYFYGDHSRYSTRFPYVLNFIYQFFGPGKLAPLLVNVLFWYFGWKILGKYLKVCSAKTKLLAAGIYSLLPVNIFMTTELLRESIMYFFILFASSCMAEWMAGGGGRKAAEAFLACLPAFFLHMASIALMVSFVVTVFFWSVKNQKWCLTKSKTVFLFIGCIAAVLFFQFRLYQYIDKFPAELTIQAITGRSFAEGRSDYLRNVSVTTLPEFLVWSVIRSFYFWFSPVITDWSSVTDLAAAVLDAVPFFLMFLLVLPKRRERGSGTDKRYLAGLLTLFMYTVLYAWGTSNAGTAMRHRNMLMGVILLTYCMKNAVSVPELKGGQCRDC